MCVWRRRFWARVTHIFGFNVVGVKVVLNNPDKFIGMRRSPSGRLLFLASVALVLAAIIYIVMRPTPILLQAIGFQSQYRFQAPTYLRWLFGSLPTMLHVYSFSIISFLLLKKKTKQAVAATTAFWVVVNLLFEIGQASGFKKFWMEYRENYIVGPLAGYFLYGTFDWNDLAFSLLGGVVSYLTIKGMRT